MSGTTLKNIVHDILVGKYSGGHDLDEISNAIDARRKADGLTDKPIAQKNQCGRCGTSLDEFGYCRDETCPHSDYLQHETWNEG